jgi:serine/threonine-protein kinase
VLSRRVFGERGDVHAEPSTEEIDMKLGSSLRRRRGSQPKKAKDPAAGAPTTGWGVLLTPRTLGLAAVVALVGLGLGYGFATRVLFPVPDALTGLVQVPDVAGMTLSSVEQALAEAGLDLGTVERFRHPSADSGRVVGQAPLPGQLMLPGRAIRVAVSVGPDRHQVPSVARLVGHQAVDLLRATGFDVVVDSTESDLPRGRVVEVVPPPGSALALPAEVRLRVSLGPPSIEMPILLGLSEVVATDSITALGLVVGEVEEVFRFGRDQGRVVGQEPLGGTELERGSAVRLVVGRRRGG